MCARGKCTKPRTRATYQATLSRTALSSTEPRTNLCKDFPVPAVSRTESAKGSTNMQGRKEDKGTQEVSGSSEARQGVASTNS